MPAAKQPAEPVTLPSEPCIHGLSDQNFCGTCRAKAGDSHAAKMNKAFRTKRPKTHLQKAAIALNKKKKKAKAEKAEKIKESSK